MDFSRLQDFESNKSRILDRVDLLDVVSEHVTLKRRGRRPAPWRALAGMLR